ncbi:MAG: hypothetical protein LBR73_03685 [Oscillospiraceae bacterium]|jgi:hypothetical protein|nr:hypothetical protein [Oscillospiraceae bacterium]
MLESLQSWAVSLALAALAGGLVWLLSPKGSVQKSLRTVAAVFLLCAVLQPVFQMGGIEDLFAGYSQEVLQPQLEAESMKQVQAALEAELEAQIGTLLAEQGIAGAQTEIQTVPVTGGGISIQTARVVLPAGFADKAADIEAALTDKFGFEIEVVG